MIDTSLAFRCTPVYVIQVQSRFARALLIVSLSSIAGCTASPLPSQSVAPSPLGSKDLSGDGGTHKPRSPLSFTTSVASANGFAWSYFAKVSQSFPNQIAFAVSPVAKLLLSAWIARNLADLSNSACTIDLPQWPNREAQLIAQQILVEHSIRQSLTPWIGGYSFAVGIFGDNLRELSREHLAYAKQSFLTLETQEFAAQPEASILTTSRPIPRFAGLRAEGMVADKFDFGYAPGFPTSESSTLSERDRIRARLNARGTGDSGLEMHVSNDFQAYWDGAVQPSAASLGNSSVPPTFTGGRWSDDLLMRVVACSSVVKRSQEEDYQLVMRHGAVSLLMISPLSDASLQHIEHRLITEGLAPFLNGARFEPNTTILYPAFQLETEILESPTSTCPQRLGIRGDALVVERSSQSREPRKIDRVSSHTALGVHPWGMGRVVMPAKFSGCTGQPSLDLRPPSEIWAHGQALTLRFNRPFLAVLLGGSNLILGIARVTQPDPAFERRMHELAKSLVDQAP